MQNLYQWYLYTAEVLFPWLGVSFILLTASMYYLKYRNAKKNSAINGTGNNT